MVRYAHGGRSAYIIHAQKASVFVASIPRSFFMTSSGYSAGLAGDSFNTEGYVGAASMSVLKSANADVHSVSMAAARLFMREWGDALPAIFGRLFLLRVAAERTWRRLFGGAYRRFSA